MEVLIGAHTETESTIRDFLSSQFDIIPVEDTVAEMTVQLRRAHRLRLPDAIIWATAQVYQSPLITRNTKDFNPAWEGIHVPYTLP